MQESFRSYSRILSKRLACLHRKQGQAISHRRRQQNGTTFCISFCERGVPGGGDEGRRTSGVHHSGAEFADIATTGEVYCCFERQQPLCVFLGDCRKAHDVASTGEVRTCSKGQFLLSVNFGEWVQEAVSTGEAFNCSRHRLNLWSVRPVQMTPRLAATVCASTTVSLTSQKI